jgi:hypothetical protein
VRLEDWATSGFQQRVDIQGNETAGLSHSTSEQPEVVSLREPINIKSTARRALVDTYIAEVFRKTGRTITRADIWRAAGYQTRSAFGWQWNDSKRPNSEADRRFTQILKDKPHLKEYLIAFALVAGPA